MKNWVRNIFTSDIERTINRIIVQTHDIWLYDYGS